MRRHGSHQLNHPHSTWPRQVEPSKVTHNTLKISFQILYHYYHSINLLVKEAWDITMTILMPKVLTKPKTRNGNNPNGINACCLASGTVLQEVPTNCNLSAPESHDRIKQRQQDVAWHSGQDKVKGNCNVHPSRWQALVFNSVQQPSHKAFQWGLRLLLGS